MKGRLIITLFDYMKNMLHELPIELTGFVNPAAAHLFEVRKSDVKLKASEAELF